MTDSVTWEKKGDAIVFRFHGSIESDATRGLRQTIMKVLRDNQSEIAVFHLEDAVYIDSMGIGMFVNLHVRHHDRVKFLFCNLSEGVSRAFGYVKLISFFDIRDNLEDILEELHLDDV